MQDITRSRRLAAMAAICLWVPVCIAQHGSDLTELSFEELLDVEVTSVSKRAQPLSEAAAAAFVISNEDIRRSGATSIPEALRMVPGLQVSQLDANKWAVSSRGFASRFGNKLLVLIDGRTVYSPGFSGVYWEQLDVVLDDVDRIEVIRGPGATLWGANAVNGVINIITKPASATRGGLAVAGGGTEEKLFSTLRYGAELAPHTNARAYVKYQDKDDMVTQYGNGGKDDWNITQGGFRMDAETELGDRFTFQGDVYHSNFNQELRIPNLVPPDYQTIAEDDASSGGWNLLGRWEKPLSTASDVSLQVYFDHVERHENAFVEQQFDTFDVDFQHRIELLDQNNLIWGLGYRHIDTKADSTATGTADFDTLTTDLWSAFIQDEVELVPDKLLLTIGSKFERNDFTGNEVQPNVRLLWKLDESKVVWGAVSRAVRTPSIGEHNVRLVSNVFPPNAPPLGLPSPTTVVNSGNKDFESEEMIAYELGFRLNPRPSFSLDVALYLDDYDNLRTVETAMPYPSAGPSFILPTPFGNKAKGTVYGVEVAADWLLREGWRKAAAYSISEADLETDRDSVDTTQTGIERNIPRHQLSLRSMLNITSNIDFDAWLRYVDKTQLLGVQTAATDYSDAYWDLDLRLAWRPRKNVELSIVGQNLLEDSRLEGSQEVNAPYSSEVERGVYGAVKVQF